MVEYAFYDTRALLVPPFTNFLKAVYYLFKTRDICGYLYEMLCN